MTRTPHRLYAAVPVTAAIFSLMLLVHALWIPVKAEVAQWLIARSWEQTLAGETDASPWPWADTRAVGVLTVPGRGIRQMILEGNSGRNLAFGPVLMDGSEESEDLVLNGHRDTHFRFLQDLKKGDRLQIELPGRTRSFEVTQIDIVDSRQRELIIEPGVRRLSLVTCYPFDTPVAGGPQRYVVTALPADPDFSRPRSPSSS
jgi:sortase A